MAERESPYLWSTTALTNGSVDPNINFAEGQLPSTVNNSARALMAAAARFLKDTNGSLTTGGSANAYTLTINGTQTAYAAGQVYVFQASFTNTGAATLNITNADAAAIGAKAIKVTLPGGEAALSPSMLTLGGRYIVMYDPNANASAGAFLLLNPSLETDTSFFPNVIGGLTLSNDGGSPNTVLDIAAGAAADSTNATIIKIGAFTKSVSGAWASGSGSNGMGNGLTIANSTWYHVILANNNGASDIWFDTSATGANKPSGITDTKYRRIGSFKTDGSAHIVSFIQVGNDFILAVPVLEQNNATVPTTATLVTFIGVPTGVKVKVNFRYALVAGTAASRSILFQSPDETSAVAGATAGNADGFAINTTVAVNVQASMSVRTNTSAQLRWSTDSGGTASAYVDTFGWTDWRGNT